ncbi:lipid II:glycine glycyltransferase FemX [Actinospica robiniae]|uniref:lipid II:glycine glycyltransferase FemX n=1 Tax=Actinospica robiniae TaxID=304901 RepID=UPI0003F4F1A0|nr:peptidoglycan bridge formation glycyltransferase FemA/FemB family protein [Actinospica robiniae]
MTDRAGIVVRKIEGAAHLAFLKYRADPEQLSFLQAPAWGGVKAAWRSESLGWFQQDELVGTALVLYRDLPALPLLGRRCLAYIPEGPTLSWFADGCTPADWLGPLVGHLRAAGACSVKLGPKVVTRRWSAESVKRGMAQEAVTDFAELAADAAEPEAERLIEHLHALGWRRRAAPGGGIADQQPRHFVRIPLEGRTEADLFASFNSQWRRNVRTAERAGVKVWRADPEQLPVFHRLYFDTARRDGFTPRPLQYFQQMFRVLGERDPDGIRLYLAGADAVPSAGATMVRLGRHAWFGYGASADSQRELRASNALQWRMIRNCLAEGMAVYDLRGVGSTLDPAHPMFGLLRFKIGTGGEVVEYPGEYDYPISRWLDAALRYYLRRR